MDAAAAKRTSPAGSVWRQPNPYRSQSVLYVLFGGLIERPIGRVRMFINAENLGNARRTRWESIIRPTRAVDGRWTVDAWAPLDGRVLNGGCV